MAQFNNSKYPSVLEQMERRSLRNAAKNTASRINATGTPVFANTGKKISILISDIANIFISPSVIYVIIISQEYAKIKTFYRIQVEQNKNLHL